MGKAGEQDRYTNFVGHPILFSNSSVEFFVRMTLVVPGPIDR